LFGIDVYYSLTQGSAAAKLLGGPKWQSKAIVPELPPSAAAAAKPPSR